MNIHWQRGFRRVFVVAVIEWAAFVYGSGIRTHLLQSRDSLRAEREGYDELVRVCAEAALTHAPLPDRSFCAEQSAIYQRALRERENNASLEHQVRQAFLPPLLAADALVAFVPPALVYAILAISSVVARWVLRGFRPPSPDSTAAPSSKH